MGLCDLIPGISGGSVAYLTGIYEKLVFNLKNIRHIKTVDWTFLFTLISGMVFAIFLFANVIKAGLQHPTSRMCLFSFFLGLVMTAALLNLRHLNKIRHGSIWVLLGIVFAVLLSFVNFKSPQRYSVDFSKQELYLATHNQAIKNYDENTQKLTMLDLHSAYALAKTGKRVYIDKRPVSLKELEFFMPKLFQPTLFLSGVATGIAMLLPGISGSTMLHILGVYTAALSAASTFMTHANIADFFLLLNLGFGVIAGMLFCARFIYYLLQKYREKTLLFLSGLVMGSIKALWPFFQHHFILVPKADGFSIQLEVLKTTLPQVNGHFIGVLGFVFLGSTLILALEILPRIKKAKGKPKASL